jgi:TP901 family phage tail tape measure protein
MALVGEAEILITANTAEFKGQLAALDADSSLGGLGAGADSAGKNIGEDLASGVSLGAKDIGKDTEKDLEQSTGRMKGVVSDATGKMSNSLQSLGIPASLLSGTAVATIGVLALGGAVVDLGAKMQSAEAAIAASSGQSVEAVTKIGNAFLSTAGTSEHSGIEMATAFSKVAGQLKATQGSALNATEALQFMTTVSTLATASGGDLGATTQTLAGLMQAFQMNVHQAADAANVLFNASNATGQGIDTLATAMEKLRAKLGDTAPPLRDLSALVVDMTKQGITGRASITALNGAVTSLGAAAAGTTTAGKKSADVLNALGVQAKQANGSLTPLSTIIAELGPKYATMTQSQQLATSTLIFGSSAAKGMTAVINAGGDAFNKASNEVNKYGAVNKAAAVQQGTFRGTFDVMKATLKDFMTQVGQSLIPVMQELEKVFVAILPVVGVLLRDAFKVIVPIINTFVTAIKDVVTFAVEMKTPLLVVATILGATLAPALVGLGTKAVASFTEMLNGAVDWAAGTAGTITGTVKRWQTGTTEMDTASAQGAAAVKTAAQSIQESQLQVQAAMTKTVTVSKEAALGIQTSAEEMSGSFTTMAGTVETETTAAAVSVEGLATKVVASDAIIEDANATAAGSFTALATTAGASLAGIGAKLAALGPALIPAAIILGQKHAGLNVSTPEPGVETFPFSSKKFVYNEAEYQKYLDSKKKGSGVGTGLNEGELKGLNAQVSAAESSVVKPGDAYGSVAAIENAKAEEHKKKAEHADALKAAKAAEAASKKGAAEAKTAATDLTNEVIKAIKLPADEAKKSLELLGVPALKASKVLADAALPFAQAVTALEKQGFDAQNAVKVAEAGSAAVAAEAKKDAAAAAKALKATLASSTASLTGLMVNGIEVSGSVYRAAIGAAYQIQTGAVLAGAGASAPTSSPSFTSAPVAPAPTQSLSRGVVLNINAGAVQIHPAEGNDAHSLLATKGYVDNAFRGFTTELHAALSGLVVVR